MNILENLNDRLSFDKEELCPGGEKDIETVLKVSPVALPDDYIDFLKELGSSSIELMVKDDDPDSTLSIHMYSARSALEHRDDWKHENQNVQEKFFSKVWIFGDDVGDLIYFFGHGPEGFGLYMTELGVCDLKFSHKMADTLTDFLVNGIGIDVAMFDF